ncbi:MAG: biotin--[acetyl-CoA-carboxylase] ligase [Cyanobacteria bacterium J06635_15]
MDLQQLDLALKQLSPQGTGAPSMATWRPQFKIHGFDQIPSTNAQVWQLIDTGAPSGTVAIAASQTAGRGQWGRQWQSPRGGAYFSLALAPNVTADQATVLTLASAWGVAQSLNALDIPVRLKWPNDLILCGRKLGGILTESRLVAGRIAWVVVGVGLNWSNRVPDRAIGLKSFLMATDQPRIASLERLVAVTLQGIVHGYHQYQTIETNAFIRAYERLLTNRGQRVTAADGHLGEVVGVSSSGALRIRRTTESTGSANEIEYQPGEIALGYNV